MTARTLRIFGHRSWVLVMATLLVAACSSSPPATPSPGPTGSPDPSASAWENILERIGPDGEVDAELAMDAFAVAFSPLPGRQAPPGAGGEIMDGTLAVDWILRFWEDLSPDQQAFADALIHGRQPGASPPPAAIVIAVAPAMREPRVVAAAEPTDWPSLMDAMAAQLAAKLGRVYTGTLDVEIVPSLIEVEAADWNAAAWALSQDAAGEQTGPAEFCTIYIAPKGSTWTGADAAFLMAHELFHCWDYDLGQIAPHHEVPAWVKEGAATWGAADIASDSKQATGWWSKWLKKIDKSLYSRAYDAIGIYGLLQVTGVDPWSIMDEFLEAAYDGNEAAFDVLYGVGGEAFLDTWGPRYWDDSGIGPLWIYGGAGFSTALTAPVPPMVVAGPGTTKTIPAPFRAASAFWVEAAADVVVISAEGSNGFAKLLSQPAWEIEEVPTLCTLEGGCVCPDGGPAPGSFYDVAKGSQIVAGTTGNPEVGLVTVVGYNLDDFCRKPPVEGACAAGCAVSNGDPHMVTVDEHTYDFQAVGEFTLLRSADGTFEVQARQKPFRSSKSVAITSAVAVGLGEDRAVVYVGPTGTRLLVNGEEVPMLTTPSAGELQITPVPNGLKLEAPDGTIVWIMGEGDRGLNVVIAPTDDLRATGVGLLGQAAGEEGALPALPDGSPVVIGDDYRAAIYDVLAAGWEVTADSSLFDYEAGQGPASFRDPSVPEEGAPLRFRELSPAQRQAGLDACAGVANATFREQCAFDVAVTGEQGFVESYEQTEAALGPQAFGPEPTPTAPPAEDACAALTDDEILAITGFAVLEKQPGINHSGEFTGGCYWTLDAGGLAEIAEIYLNVQSPGGRAAYDEYVLDRPDLQPVADVGDAAVLYVGISITVVKGDTLIDMQYVDVFDPDTDAVVTLLARAVAGHY